MVVWRESKYFFKNFSHSQNMLCLHSKKNCLFVWKLDSMFILNQAKAKNLKRQKKSFFFLISSFAVFIKANRKGGTHAAIWRCSILKRPFFAISD